MVGTNDLYAVLIPSVRRCTQPASRFGSLVRRQLPLSARLKDAALLRRNQLKISTAPADIGMLPVPPKAWIDFTVVAGNPTKTENHASEKHHPQKQKNRDRVAKAGGGLRMVQNPSEAGETPKENEAYWYSPKQKGAPVPARIRRGRCLGGKGLSCSRMEPGGVIVCSLLIEDWRSHDVRGSALVALIGVLRKGCHRVIPDQATACDTGFRLKF